MAETFDTIFKKLIRVATTGVAGAALVAGLAATPAEAQNRDRTQKKAERAATRAVKQQNRTAVRSARQDVRQEARQDTRRTTTRTVRPSGRVVTQTRSVRPDRDGDGDRIVRRKTVVRPGGNNTAYRYRTTPQYRNAPNTRTYTYTNPGYGYNTYPNYGYGTYPNSGYSNYPNSGYNNYPNYGYGTNSGYGYNNGGYYDNRDGDLDRDEVARRASQVGYHDGYQRGQHDRAQGVRRPNPQGHGAYTHGLNGFDREWGSAGTYQQYYRQYFLSGYQAGYGSRGFDSRYQRRWW